MSAIWKESEKGDFFSTVSPRLFSLVTLKHCKSSSLKSGSRRTSFTRRLTSASDLVVVPESFQFLAFQLIHFDEQGTEMVAEKTQDQFLLLSEGPLQEQRSQEQRKAGKGIVLASQRSLWQSAVDCGQSNAGVVMLQFVRSLSGEDSDGTELQYTLEGGNAGNGWMKGWQKDGQKDGTYSAGLKDSASAYVLCPRLTEQWCLSIWKGVGNTERDLERFRERWELERSAERWER